MLFHSFDFLIFFPIVFLIYFAVPQKYRWIWLLFTSFIFYMYWNVESTFLLLIEIIITYYCGWFLYKSKSSGGKKFWLTFSIFITLGLLCFFKYLNFVTALFTHFFNFGINLPQSDLLTPLGISFFTFKMIGYLVDIYRKKIVPEKNIFKYSLFVSFFPEMVAGPIDRAPSFLSQISLSHKFDYGRVKKGLFFILFGIFQKIVIADRLAMMVNTVYDHPGDYYGLTIIFATTIYAFQIYSDFSSYSTIAIGCAAVFGYEIPQNFEQPYLSLSIKEFWHRWHISLSSWFREYLYFPLGGNRCSKPHNCLNLFIVFLVSGIWHGASVTFLLWGILHGIYQVAGYLTLKFRTVLKRKIMRKEYYLFDRLWKMFVTFALVMFAWIFFRANNLNDLKILLKNLVQFDSWFFLSSKTVMLGLNLPEFCVAMSGIFLLIAVDVLSRKTNLYEQFAKQYAPIRWAVYTVLITLCLIIGVYGPGYSSGQFIYAGF